VFVGRLSIYEYKDYKKYVLDWIQTRANEGRGQRKQLADAIGCQTPFITHVLSGNYHFSAEQAEACSTWMGLNETESEFFILLVLKQRAGTRGLEVLFGRQISERRENATVLKKRLNITETLSPEVQMIYYSSWHYSAIHIALLIPSLRSIDALQKYFALPMPRVTEVVDFLVDHGLVEQNKNLFKVSRSMIHLAKGSPLLNQHHSHWRLRAIESLQIRNNEDLHYSAAIALSREDFEWVREKLSQLLEQLVARVKDSKDEKLAAMTLDWFEV
jgi:uncharacterized protein (TIGR02147 family)